MPLRIAHRGIPGRVRENTLASFALALSEGADGIELDVHATEDDIVVVHHDPSLPDGRDIRSCAFETLGLPPLHDVLRLVNERAELFVEIKGQHIETLVLRTLHGFSGRAALHSFDHATIRRIAEHGTTWRLGLLTEERVSDPAALLAANGAQDFWPHHALVTPELVQRVHAVHGRVIPWTVNEPSRMRALAALGADGICTDDVAALAAALAAV